MEPPPKRTTPNMTKTDQADCERHHTTGNAPAAGSCDGGVELRLSSSAGGDWGSIKSLAKATELSATVLPEEGFH
jgi:hypothetical protein